MTLTQRLSAIATAAEGRAVHPEYLAAALMTYATSGRLPAGPADLGRSGGSPATQAADLAAAAATREAILDAEESLALFCGADPDGSYLAAIDAARGEAFTAASAEELRAHALGLRGPHRGVLGQLLGFVTAGVAEIVAP